jgi:hypothetical protein
MAVSLDMQLPHFMSTRVDPSHARPVIGQAYRLTRTNPKSIGMTLLIELKSLFAARLHFAAEVMSGPLIAPVESAIVVQPSAGAQE